MTGDPDFVPRPQPQRYPSKSTVVAEFVDAIPEPDPKTGFKKSRTSWEPQEGIREGLSLAFANPNRAMKLVVYDKGAPSVRKRNAELRVRSLLGQGYSEQNGWIMRAVEGTVFCMYTGRRV